MERLPDGRILPAEGAPKIRKRTTPDLDAARFPTDYIVPYTQQVHDRVSLEVLRGCTQGCRFCQAGMTTRPVRERSLSKLDTLMKESLEKTGYEEVSLVSLSTCDYSRVQQLVDQTAKRASAERVSVSLPSLRLDSFSVGLADRVAGERRTGLTFAPEAASPRLRAVINKWIPDEDLLGMASQAYDRGWGHVKLYFMIGLPTERDDDVEAIADLTLRALAVGRQKNKKARVNTGVSTFVPKPFTPFQWAEQIGIEETGRRQAILEERFRRSGGGVKFGRHNAYETWLEGLVSRTDRRAGDLIEAAWRNGARFDAWSEHLDVGAWERAIEETGFDVADALRERELDERLPWDHIDVHIPKAWFQQDWADAVALKHAPDCRHSQCHRCGVIDVERALCAHMLRNAIDGAKEEGTWTPRRKGRDEQRATTAPLGARLSSEGPIERPQDPDPVQRVRFRIGRSGDARFLSHLESMNAWLRALRRARTPLAYTQGFHAHPRVSFSTASPVGEESVGDYMDVMLLEREDPAALLGRLQATLATGFAALGACEVPLRGPALMASLDGFRFDLFAAGDFSQVSERARALVEAAEIPVERKTKKRGRSRRGTRMVDLRPMLESMAVEDLGGGQVRVAFSTRVVEGRSMRWKDALELLGLDVQRSRVLKRETRLVESEPVPVVAASALA
jgi:radical SAM-linked protein